jgi:plasmid stability protein
MFSKCFNVDYMSKMIQVRNVPDELHRRLKSRAALAGMSLSEYLLNELRLLGEQPTFEEMRERLSRLPPITPSESPAEIIRRVRDQE